MVMAFIVLISCSNDPPSPSLRYHKQTTCFIKRCTAYQILTCAGEPLSLQPAHSSKQYLQENNTDNISNYWFYVRNVNVADYSEQLWGKAVR